MSGVFMVVKEHVVQWLFLDNNRVQRNHTRQALDELRVSEHILQRFKYAPVISDTD